MVADRRSRIGGVADRLRQSGGGIRESAMKFLRFSTLVAVLALAASASAQIQTPRDTRVAVPSHVQAVLDSYVATKKVPGVVVAIGQGDNPTRYFAAGRIADAPGAPSADPDSLWRVYSMTKPVTALAAMILIDEGKLRLDQPVSDFIPGFKNMRVLVDPAKSLETRPAKNPVLIRNLLTHTAGLGYDIITTGPLLAEYQRLGIQPEAFNLGMEASVRPKRPATLAEFADRVATLPLIADPGTKWSYSIGLDVMGRVIEVASGMPFDRFLQTRIFGPLGMRSTYFTVPMSETGRFATNYLYLGNARLAADPGNASVFASPPSFPYGGAGLVMSARDYDRFLHLLQDEGTLDGVRILRPETARLMMSNLLPPAVEFGGVVSAVGGGGNGAPDGHMGFGAGGSVYLDGPRKGIYGWGGAAATVGWVDPVHKLRGTIMVNYIPSDHWPLRDDLIPAMQQDLLP
jgi:CubicO group peptidase (beta-lactamase class C family)